MTIIVSPNNALNTHDIKLTSGATEIGLILCDSSGEHNPLALSHTPYPRTSIQLSNQQSKYDNSDPLFASIPQLDWSAGRAHEWLSDNNTGYMDGYRADAAISKKAILGGQETYATGYRSVDQSMPGSVAWYGLYSATGRGRYLGRTFTASASYTVINFEAWVRRVGTPNAALSCRILADSDGAPGSALATGTVAVAGLEDGGPSQFVLVTVSQAVTSGTAYWVSFNGHASDDVTNHWEVGYDALSYGKYSTDGSTWETNLGAPYYRLTDVGVPMTARFFEYMGQLYFATHPDSGATGKLYMNGYRGACDSNNLDKSKLYDSTQTTWGSELSGCVAKMISGQPSTEQQPWRSITGSASGYVGVSPNWEITHDAYDDYVILGSNKFFEQPGSNLSGPVATVETANGVIYLGQSNNGVICKHREMNVSGTWVNNGSGDTDCWDTSLGTGRIMKTMRDPTLGKLMYMASTDKIIYDLCPTGWTGELLGTATIFDIESAWDEISPANVTNTLVMAMVSKTAVANAFTTGLIAAKAITSLDLRYHDRIEITVTPSIYMAAGVLQLCLDNTAQCASPVFTLDFPALKANVRNRCILELPDAERTTGASAIISVGLKLASDPGAAVDITCIGPIRAMKSWDWIFVDDNGSRITGLERYGEPESLWVLTESSFGMISNNQWLPHPLREMATVKDENNGRASTVNDLYMYFSFGRRGGVQRFYNASLDAVGLDRDAGLPANRQGPVTCLLSYPDRVFASVDGGVLGYSAVYCYTGTGWHEVYRAPRVGLRIRSMYIQVIPGNASDRLWISQGSDVLWLPVTMIPTEDSYYRYTHEAYIQTAKIDGGRPNITKFFKALQIASEDLAAGQTIIVDYRVDGATAWTRLAVYSTSPQSESDFTSDDSLTGKYIELRIRLNTTDNTKTPVLLGTIIDTLEVNEVHDMYTLTFRLKDYDTNLQGVTDTSTAAEKWAILKAMVAAGKPVLMNTASDMDNNVRVFPQPAGLRRLGVSTQPGISQYHLCQMSLVRYE